jgi:hypothetical protein
VQPLHFQEPAVAQPFTELPQGRLIVVLHPAGCTGFTVGERIPDGDSHFAGLPTDGAAAGVGGARPSIPAFGPLSCWGFVWSASGNCYGVKVAAAWALPWRIATI